MTYSALFWILATFTYRDLCYGDLRPKFILYNKGDTTCKLPLYDEWIMMQQTSVMNNIYTAGYEGT